jgi:hypothetical protein
VEAELTIRLVLRPGDEEARRTRDVPTKPTDFAKLGVIGPNRI